MTTSTIQTIHTLTYRFSVNNVLKTSKLSIDIGIYQILKNNESLLFNDYKPNATQRSKNSTVTDKWLYVTAGEIRNKYPNVSFTAYMRELLYTKIIENEYISGYKINTDYFKIMCAKDKSSNTLIRLPAALIYALKRLFGENEACSIIKTVYANIRVKNHEESNYSFLLRHKLLNQVLNPELNRIDINSSMLSQRPM